MTEKKEYRYIAHYSPTRALWEVYDTKTNVLLVSYMTKDEAYSLCSTLNRYCGKEYYL